MISEGSRFAPATLVAGSTLEQLKESGSASLQFVHKGRIVVGEFRRQKQENSTHSGRVIIDSTNFEAAIRVKLGQAEIAVGK